MSAEGPPAREHAPRQPDPRVNPARWTPPRFPDDPRWPALCDLAGELRAVLDLLADTQADASALREAAELVARARGLLAAYPRARRQWAFPAEVGELSRANFDDSPLSGLANPIAPPVRFRILPDAVEGEVVFGRAYEGPPGHVHGGWVAATFDELLGVTQTLSGRAGVTGSLAVRYRRPVPLGQRVTLRGWIERVHGRRIQTRGELRAGEELCAEGEAVFVALDWDRYRALEGEREGRADLK